MKKFLSFLMVAMVLLGVVACGGKTESEDPASEGTEPEEVLPQEDNKIHLFILTGQSGARGKALVTDLDEEQKEPNYDVDICADGYMMPSLNNIKDTLSSNVDITELKPGFGDGAGEFGPELGMGETLASRFPKDGDARKSVIVKYTACGSTFTDHWYSKSMLDDEQLAPSLVLNQIRENPKTGEATGPLTNNLYQIIDFTIETLESEGYEVVIDGAAFVHGEQDAKYDVNMSIYEKALTYFIKDLREYVGNNELPFVITEALTNSAKYSNELRAIQKRVAEKDANAAFISATDLYTNTFEPWHFGAESNFILGNRIAAELISLNDTRKVSSIDEDVLNVPLGAEVKLPSYVKASFDNGYSGYLKVTYTGTYDKNSLGEQEVAFKAKTGLGTKEFKLKVKVTDEPFVDGVLNEYANRKKHVIDGVGELYVVKGETGLYVAANIFDKELYTSGESWHSGDMGQKGSNDDFRVFLTETTAAERYTICLSAANLLRVYEAGTSFNNSVQPSKNSNMLYCNYLYDYAYHVTTNGYVNDDGNQTSNGMTLEFYIAYEDLGITNPDNLKLCFNYNNVSTSDGKLINSDNFYCAKEVEVANPEENDEYYFAISSLLS